MALLEREDEGCQADGGVRTQGCGGGSGGEGDSGTAAGVTSVRCEGCGANRHDMPHIRHLTQ